MKPKRPALRYHGGKWMLAPWIISCFPPHRVYVEPFGGAASVLLRKTRSYAEVYNDLDGDVVNLFRVLRDRVSAEHLAYLLSATPFARDEFEQAYQTAAAPIERARRMVVRSFMGFGSDATTKRTGFRANSNRSGSPPAHDWANLPNNVLAITARLRGVVIENRDASTVMAQHDSADTLHYVDPPYVHETRSKSVAGNLHATYAHEMTDEDHRRVAEKLHRLKGMVAVSGYPSELYDRLYPDWQRIERPALADGARKRTEVLWLNPAAAQYQPRDLLEEVK